jgi:hypothetical protein
VCIFIIVTILPWAHEEIKAQGCKVSQSMKVGKTRQGIVGNLHHAFDEVYRNWLHSNGWRVVPFVALELMCQPKLKAMG